ncbi:hypothetical protein CFP56_029986 [Quercus suber]|uniref:Uncharacterized protein n=1 Tax=Quercus suber TaxID=58331 RepID=A0AAW0JQ30_QUESU
MAASSSSASSYSSSSSDPDSTSTSSHRRRRHRSRKDRESLKIRKKSHSHTKRRRRRHSYSSSSASHYSSPESGLSDMGTLPRARCGMASKSIGTMGLGHCFLGGSSGRVITFSRVLPQLFYSQMGYQIIHRYCEQVSLWV